MMSELACDLWVRGNCKTVGCHDATNILDVGELLKRVMIHKLRFHNFKFKTQFVFIHGAYKGVQIKTLNPTGILDIRIRCYTVLHSGSISRELSCGNLETARSFYCETG